MILRLNADAPGSGNPHYKIVADPVHGFISIPRKEILPLIQTPEVQRLRRIRQLGVGNFVFPGAEHSRFSHALGAMALMQDTILTLRGKDTPISEKEESAALAAALLHDIGHGPFSHSLEHILISDFEHEQMSRALIVQLAERFGGSLHLALEMFDNTCDRPFFHQLISSQLDMDRLDYLRRDSYFTGVVEGKVGVQRIIKSMLVSPTAGRADARMVIEPRGIYPVENFLFARRLMYWQVYLHKTVLAGDHLLQGILRRARYLLGAGDTGVAQLGAPALLFFLQHDVKGADIQNPDVRAVFCELDDSDIIYSMKRWAHHRDPILVDLCRRFNNRDFLRVRFLGHEASDDEAGEWREQVKFWLLAQRLTDPEHADDDVSYYFGVDEAGHAAYGHEPGGIDVLMPEGIQELSTVTDTAAIASLTLRVEKPYVCYPKEVKLSLSRLEPHEDSRNR
ncbi:MAG: HD domain-containing protein [Rhodothermales bacterium]